MILIGQKLSVVIWALVVAIFSFISLKKEHFIALFSSTNEESEAQRDLITCSDN